MRYRCEAREKRDGSRSTIHAAQEKAAQGAISMPQMRLTSGAECTRTRAAASRQH